MRREVPVLIVIALTFSSFVWYDITSGRENRPTSTIIVDSGGGGDFTSIQAAVDSARPGDDIFVRAGTYYGVVNVNMRLNITGAGASTTIVDGGRPDHLDVINLAVDGIKLSGISTTNGYLGHEFAGIAVRGRNCEVFNCSSYQNDYGLILWSNGNMVHDNDLSSNNRNGIHAKFCSLNVIENNTCSSSAITQGIWLEGCRDNIVRNNTCSRNYKYGISLYQSSFNRIEGNTCSDSELFNGINVYSSPNNNITGNRVFSNGNGGIRIASDSDSSSVTWNDIHENKEGVQFWMSNVNCIVRNNRIHNNTVFGLNCTASTMTVDARMNWWGTPSGPYHSTLNPDGSGNEVSDNVDFIPWLGGEPVNHPPVIENPFQFNLTEDIWFSHTFTASDLDSDPLTWTFETGLDWLSWDAESKKISGIPDNGDVGQGCFILNVSDGRGGFDERRIDLIVNNTPPRIIGIDVVYTLEDRIYENDYGSTDDDQGNITWSLVTNSSFLSIDADNGTIKGTPLNENVGSWFVNITVDDGNGGKDSRNFTLVVSNMNDPPVGLFERLDVMINEDSTATFEIEELFMDPDDDDLELSVYHQGHVQPYVSAFGSLEIVPARDWSGRENFTLYARDGFVEVPMEVNVTVIAVNDPPEGVTITAPEGPYFSNRSYIFTGSAGDADLPYGDELNYTWSVEGLSIIGYGVYAVVNLTMGTYALNLTVRDTGNLSSNALFLIDVENVTIDNGTGPDQNETEPDDDEQPVDDDEEQSDDDDTEPADDDNDNEPPVKDDGWDPMIFVFLSSVAILIVVLIIVIAFIIKRGDRDLVEE